MVTALGLWVGLSVPASLAICSLLRRRGSPSDQGIRPLVPRRYETFRVQRVDVFVN